MSNRVLGPMLILALVGASLWWASVGRGQPHAARAMAESGAPLIDVRTTAEFEAGHLPNAVNIPVNELPNRLKEVGAKDRPVVVYCRSGNRSARARRLLEEAGYTTVFNLGAMSNWQ